MHVGSESEVKLCCKHVDWTRFTAQIGLCLSDFAPAQSILFSNEFSSPLRLLSAEVIVPLPRELPVLLVEGGKEDVILPVPIARILLHAHIVIAVVLC